MRKTIARLCAMMLALLCFFSTTFAQNNPVSGTVTDQNGAGIPGVTITVRGTNVATQTDAQGHYTVNAPNNGVLVLSSVGYGTSEVYVNGQTTVNSTLTTQGTNLNEVVVVGYGTARRRDITGSVATVKEKDFNKGVFTAPDQLIQGKAAGVLVINNTGQPGGSTTVRIRGASSIRSGNQPLFVVDGVPLSGGSARPGGSGGGNFGSDAGNPLNFINPNDIASIEILKDASATAIYGSRGANGVVIITTKRGQSGAPHLDASASTGFSNVAKKLEVLNADEYRQALRDYKLVDTATGALKGDFGSNVDAWDAITRTALTQNYNVAASGGNENGRYRVSAGVLDQQGIIETSAIRKYTASLTSQFRFLESKKLGLDINILASQNNESIAPVSAFVGFEGNLISQALQWNPTHPLIKPGTDSAWIDPAVGETTINPVAQLRYYRDRSKTNAIVASISPSYRITKDLEYRFLYSINRQVGIRKGMVNRLLNVSGLKDRGAAFVNDLEQTDQQITNTLNYNKQVTSALNVNAVIGHEWLTFDRRGSGFNGRDFPNVGLYYYDILGAASQTSLDGGSFADPTRELQSFFARAILNYEDKYLLTGTFRADGSTRFGQNNKYGYFPSLAFAWNVSNEEFLKSNSLVNNLKFRLSWGKTGNQEFPSGASLNRYSIGRYNPDDAIFPFNQGNVGNPDLRWESSTTLDAGVDFSILNNKLNGSIDYFHKKTTDVLFEQNIVQPGPPTKIWINLPGYVLNSGVEIMLNAGIMSRQDMNWNVSANASFLKNDVEGVLGFYETGDLRGQGFSDVRGQRVISGQPLNVWYLRRFEGIDKTTGQSIYADNGDTKFYSGSPNPKMLLGFSTDFTYKKLTATLNMNGTFGHYLYNNTAASVLGIGNLGTRNFAKSVLESPVKEAVSNAPAPSTRNLEKGDYIKMANASLAYRIGNIGKDIRNVTISLTGQNLFVITKYTGFDPEVNTDAGFGGIPSLGVEYIPYPSARTVTLGVNFSL